MASKKSDTNKAYKKVNTIKTVSNSLKKKR